VCEGNGLYLRVEACDENKICLLFEGAGEWQGSFAQAEKLHVPGLQKDVNYDSVWGHIKS
jgi:hypothetical protein